MPNIFVSGEKKIRKVMQHGRFLPYLGEAGCIEISPEILRYMASGGVIAHALKFFIEEPLFVPERTFRCFDVLAARLRIVKSRRSTLHHVEQVWRVVQSFVG